MNSRAKGLNAKNQNCYLKAFLLTALIAAIMFIPVIIMGKGIFYYYGDYNAQQIPFNMLAHRAVRSGNIFWNWDTDLGANFIGSYSFYVIGSPFFWLMLPFPTEAVPYLLGPVLMLKFICAGFFAYCYIRRFVRNQNAAVIGGLLYAFSGFSLYNIFFNHFHEAIVFFPLLLLGLELLMKEKRRGVFALAVFVCAVSNYFFFIAMAVFLVPYFILRCLSPDWRLTFPKFLSVALEALLGVGLACVIFLPAILSVLSNSRVSDLLLGWNLLVYPNSQIYPNILLSAFLPADMPSMSLYCPDAGTQWASLSAWLPLFSTVGVIGFVSAYKKHWIKRIIILCLVFTLVPVLNSSFVMLNASYYARWFFMPVLMMCLCTACAVDRHTEINWWSAFRITLIITVLAVLCIGLLPNIKDLSGNITRLGLYGLGDPNEPEEAFWNPIRFWANGFVAVACLAIVAFIIPHAKRKGKTFIKMSLVSTVIVCIIVGSYHIESGHAADFTAYDDFEGNFAGDVSVDWEKNANYRIDLYNCYVENSGMMWQTPCIQAFNSVVPSSIMDFYTFIGVQRDVASRPETSQYAIRSLLSVKYLADYKKDDDKAENRFKNDDGTLKMPGFEFVRTDGNYDIYENKYYVPIGFTYNAMMSEKTAQKFGKSNAGNMMLKAIMLSDKDLKKYSNILPILDVDSRPLFDEVTLAVDTAALRENCVSKFSRDNRGFSATAELENENLVFFSVPYENGWSVKVDGKPAEIIKANSGMMAVKVPQGTHSIRFDYMTPGLIYGIYISLASLVILIIYLLLCRSYRRSGNGSDNVDYGAKALKSTTADGEIPDDEQLSDFLSEIGEAPETNLFDK